MKNTHANTIDISGPLKTFAYGMSLAILATLISIMIKKIPNNEVYTDDFITTNVEIQHSYYIENKDKYLAEVSYECKDTTYIVYIFTQKESQQGNHLTIKYDKTNNKRCYYEGKEYLAQPLVNKTQ